MKKFVLGILASVWIGFWLIFAQNISPDSAEISVKDPVIMWEATNLKVTILKNWSKMTSYNWSIWMVVTEEDWTKLKDNEYTVPSRWMYTYLSSPYKSHLHYYYKLNFNDIKISLHNLYILNIKLIFSLYQRLFIFSADTEMDTQKITTVVSWGNWNRTYSFIPWSRIIFFPMFCFFMNKIIRYRMWSHWTIVPNILPD